MYSLLFDIWGLARLGRDGRAGALTALPVVVRADRDRGEGDDRDQDRHQRRGRAVVAAAGLFARAELGHRFAVAEPGCTARTAARLAAVAVGALVTLAGVGAAARTRSVAAARASAGGGVGLAGFPFVRPVGAALAPALRRNFFVGDVWYVRGVHRSGRFF